MCVPTGNGVQLSLKPFFSTYGTAELCVRLAQSFSPTYPSFIDRPLPQSFPTPFFFFFQVPMVITGEERESVCVWRKRSKQIPKYCAHEDVRNRITFLGALAWRGSQVVDVLSIPLPP